MPALRACYEYYDVLSTLRTLLSINHAITEGRGSIISRLIKIRDSAEHAAIAISSALRVDVAVIDSDCTLVAASKGYIEGRGPIIHRPYIEAVFREKVIVCDNPGTFSLCAGCRWEGKCPETAEILCAIDMDGEAIGVITMIAFNNKQRTELLQNINPLLEFIQEMAELLISKIREREALVRTSYANRLLETTLDSVTEGIIAFDWKGSITHANKVARQLLGIMDANLINVSIDDLLPGKHFLAAAISGKSIQRQEYMCSVPKPVHCFISVKPIQASEHVTGAVLCLSDFQDIRSVIHDLGGMRSNLTMDAIIGNSTQIIDLKHQALQIAQSDSTILIQAESGTGKELLARAIHSSSPRARSSFVALNCAAIPETLLESELFGYEEGAFTGARKGGKPGTFELADGGTLFLDEIGDMPLHLQIKLLRLIEERQITRVGGTAIIPLDVRIIAATNQNLETKLRAGEFRHDLYYRLNVIPLTIPPLRERKSDIAILSSHFLSKYNRKLRKNIEGFAPDAFEAILRYDWPGNVRELQNTVEYSVNVETSSCIRKTSLPRRLTESLEHCSALPASLAERVKRYEQDQILETLARHGGHVHGKERAAQELGISIPTLYRKLKSTKESG